jgi:hypothetical protein
MAKDWLYSFLSICVRGFNDQDAQARLETFRQDNPDWPNEELIRRWVEYRLRERGVVYGTPLASEETIANHTQKGYQQRRAIFLAILRVEAELAMEIGCALSHVCQEEHKIAELMVCFALFCGKFKLAKRIDRLIQKSKEDKKEIEKVQKVSTRLGRALDRQAYLTGNPLLGLPIHNSFNYVDAKTLGRIAVVYYEHGLKRQAKIDNVLKYKIFEKEILIKAMLGLSLADRPLGVSSIKVMVEQIKLAKFPRRERKALLKLLKGNITPMAVAAAVNDDKTRDFLLEQVILGAVLDGHFSKQEENYIGDLAGWLGVPLKTLAEMEARVIDFYDVHKAYLDIFTVGSAVRSYRQRMLSKLQTAISENMGLIVDEVKNKKGLAELLYRASTGDKLTRSERKKMGKQLLDILRTIPSLAIFSLPGGAMLLPLVFKFMPEGLKPKAFAEYDRKKKNEGEKDLI